MNRNALAVISETLGNARFCHLERNEKANIGIPKCPINCQCFLKTPWSYNVREYINAKRSKRSFHEKINGLMQPYCDVPQFYAWFRVLLSLKEKMCLVVTCPP